VSSAVSCLLPAHRLYERITIAVSLSSIVDSIVYFLGVTKSYSYRSASICFTSACISLAASRPASSTSSWFALP
jgi:hypothetical protein